MISCLSENTPQELLDKVKSLSKSHSILSIYGLNGRHYIWLKENPKLEPLVQPDLGVTKAIYKPGVNNGKR